MHDTATGKYYFWNTVSNEVQWHKPFEMNEDELDDPDDLVRGAGIETHDYKIIEAPADKHVDDLFDGTEELAKNIKLVRDLVSRLLFCVGGWVDELYCCLCVYCIRARHLVSRWRGTRWRNRGARQAGYKLAKKESRWPARASLRGGQLVSTFFSS